MAKTLDEAGVKRLIQEIKGANKNLNTPIPISTENTPESMAQNVQNIADYVEKAKAAGIANVNGMAVTCLIDGENSGVGYLYVTNTQVLICGIQAYEDSSVSCISVIDGTYSESSIVVEGHIGQITSDMLVKGARNPIILTESTTEVDGETYQKLEEMADATDVVFRTNSFEFMPLIAKDMGNELRLIFGYTLCDASNLSVQNSTCSYVVITVETAFPYKVTIDKSQASLETILNTSGYLNKSTLSPVLQEIDLTGPPTDRKAKLDKFATDWKALTGASDLKGARFVGLLYSGDIDTTIRCLFSFGQDTGFYSGVSVETTDNEVITKIQVATDGSITITPLFSHLEAITIYTDNTAEHMQANLDNIAAYEANLQALGVNTSAGITEGGSPIIPIITYGTSLTGYIQSAPDVHYNGFAVYTENTVCYEISVRSDGYYKQFVLAYQTSVDAKVDKSLNAKSLEAITIKTSNSTTDKADNKAAIQAYVNNLKALGVDTTKGYMIPVKLDSGSLDGFVSYHSDTADYPWSGLLIRPGGTGKFMGINKDGLVVLIPDILTHGEQLNLTTSSKQIVGAINEVNTLAKGVKAFGAIELKASDNAANKAAITAYLKILTDAGVSTTNGYAVPVRITGNSQEYHGMLNIGTGVLLSGVVTDVNENHHYPFNVSTTDGVITFNESNYFLEKTSNEVTEMLDAIKYSYTSVPFTDTTLSNKAQLEVFLSKVPAATVMHCTYKDVYAGTLHKINGDWYGLLVKNTNNYEDAIQVKLQADGTLIEGTTSLAQVNSKLNEIIG